LNLSCFSGFSETKTFRNEKKERAKAENKNGKVRKKEDAPVVLYSIRKIRRLALAAWGRL